MRISIALSIAALATGCGHMTRETTPGDAHIDLSNDADLKSLVQLRPQLAKKIETLAPADLQHLPWMLSDMSMWERRIEGAKPAMLDRRASSIGEPVSNPSDAQLVTSVIGHRIEELVAKNSPEAVGRVLHNADYMLPSINYLYFPIESKTAGDQPISYSAPPRVRTIHLPIAGSSGSAYDANR